MLPSPLCWGPCPATEDCAYSTKGGRGLDLLDSSQPAGFCRFLECWGCSIRSNENRFAVDYVTSSRDCGNAPESRELASLIKFVSVQRGSEG